MSSTKYADEGTVAHQLAAMCLAEGTDAAAYIGRLIECEDYEHAKLSPSSAKKWMACPGSHRLEHPADAPEFESRFFSMEVTEDMAEYVQVYLDAVRARVEEYKLAGADNVTLLVEQKLPIGHITGEEGATGSGDAVIIATWPDGNALIDVGDLKTGMGVVVEAEDNPQLQLYALGALHEHGLLYEFQRARLTIYQPRVKREPSDWEVSVEDLEKFSQYAKERAFHAIQVRNGEVEGAVIHHLRPGAHCRESFCKARATCPKLREEVATTVSNGVFDASTLDDFKDLNTTDLVGDMPEEWLATAMSKTDIIEDWCKAVRAEVERRLLAGTPVPGYKLVQGKKGARAWTDADEVEKTFKSMRLKQEEMYDFKLISPTSAEKLLKETPKRWARVLPLIGQSEGKPSVAPESDKRPALVIAPTADDFDVVDDSQPNAAVVAAMGGDDLAG